MNKRRLISILAALVISIGTIGDITPAYADDDAPPPPIIVETEVDFSGAGDSVVPGPGGESVTITNRYYPYYGGSVKTDGKANGNFYQPSGSRYKCQSHVYNSAGQVGTTTTSYGSYGGTNCPYTTKASLGGVVPTTYTTWTKSWWKWSDGTSGYGISQQSHYED